jgi:hypothetical protein
MSNLKKLLHELKHHLPFTIIATLIGIISLIFIKYVLALSFEEEAFELLHPLHVIFSGMVSSGIFYKYKKNTLEAMAIGVISSILIGSISDVILPFLGGTALLLKPEFHLPIIEKPLIILSAALFGSFIGINAKITKLPHTFHVLLSVFASLFYLTAFTPNLSITYLTISSIIIIIAVVIPCCVSDILLPFFFLGKRIEQCHCHTH